MFSLIVFLVTRTISFGRFVVWSPGRYFIISSFCSIFGFFFVPSHRTGLLVRFAALNGTLQSHSPRVKRTIHK
ncbi:MAG: hypothetical protein KGY49_13055, partial [Wenzhouxiangellaceae bacterium]|nr:hypothetical protein [Wenzhouxiangellaceae bacterium]